MADQEAMQQGVGEGELFRLLVENTTDYAIFTVAPDGRVLTWNPGAERLLGYREAEILGQSSFRTFTPEDVRAGEPEREIETARTTGRAEDDRWHFRKDGSRFWCTGIMVPLRDDTGQVRAFAKVMRDFTQRKLAEDAVRASEERLRVALCAAQMGTWLWHIAADEQILDESLQRLMGLAPAATQGTLEDFLQAVHADDRTAVRQAFEHSLRERGDLNIEFRVVWPDGSLHWLRDQGKVFHDGGRPVYMTGACVDITERKSLEQALRQRARELAEADRRKDEFLAMLAHELRNPLAPIRSTLEVLRLHKIEDPRLQKAYATIDRQVGHLARLVDDLLDVSRITRGKIRLYKEVVELGTVVGHAVEMVRPHVEARNHELMVSLPVRPVRLEADETRLTQVLFNLLENAAKYTEPGGRIWLTAEPEDGHVVVRVRDTGMGMAAELVPKVFDIFAQGERTLDRSQGGLGIGLTLVRGLVEMHGASVQAISPGPGQGSEFVVRLPVMPGSPPDRPVPAEVRVPGARAARILVVDDTADVAESLAMLLESLGHEVRLACDGAQALEAARSWRPEAVLLDIGLPGMDGYEVARRLRREPGLGPLLLVAVSGYGQDEDRRRSHEAGFDHHLVKPVSQVVLQRLLGRSGAPSGP